MDRFDCRLLLDSQRQLKLNQTSTLNGLEDGGERMADELWAERYGDLESAMRAQEEEERGVSLKEGDGGQGTLFGSKDDQGVNQPEPQSMPADEGGSKLCSQGGGGGFSFSSQHPPPDPPHSEPALSPPYTAPIIPNKAPPPSSSCYHPPYLLLPDHLKPENLPTSEKQHKIIVETSRFVRLNGGQVEVLLKVKQAANPSFGFLLHDHPLHPYYQWIVEKDPRVMADIDAAPSLGDNRDSHQHPLSSSTGHVKDASPPIHVAAAADPPWRQKGEANNLSRSVCVQQDTSHHMPTQNLQPGPAGPSVSTARAPPVSSSLKEQSATETLARADNWSYEDMLREKERDQGRSKGSKSRRRSRSRSKRRRRSTSKSSRDSRSRSRSRDRSRRHRSPSRSRERPKRSRSTSTERRDERSKKKRRHRRSRRKYNSRERRYI